jgi:hypothetical protein
MKENKTRQLHKCNCEKCQQHPHSETSKEHRAINRVLAGLDEKSRRRVVGMLALKAEFGDIQRLIEITGLSRNTICRGRTEVRRVEPIALSQRVRQVGGGRPIAEKKNQK